MKYDAIFLDCDGVIFDSNDLKIKAFEKIANHLDSSIVSNFLNYTRKHFGSKTREEFFQYLLTLSNASNNKDHDEELSVMRENYGSICLELYMRANFTPNLNEFLDKHKSSDLYVVSASDQNELRSVFKARNIDDHFVEIYGNKNKKVEILKSLLSKYQRKETVMIGDSYGDMEAAELNNIPFIFMKTFSIASENEIEEMNLNSIKTILDLSEI